MRCDCGWLCVVQLIYRITALRLRAKNACTDGQKKKKKIIIASSVHSTHTSQVSKSMFFLLFLGLNAPPIAFSFIESKNTREKKIWMQYCCTLLTGDDALNRREKWPNHCSENRRDKCNKCMCKSFCVFVIFHTDGKRITLHRMRVPWCPSMWSGLLSTYVNWLRVRV